MDIESRQDTDWAALSGLADGELEPADQAALAARLAREPQLVAGLRQVAALKAAVAELGRDGAPSMPELEALPVRRRWSLGQVIAPLLIAALLALPLERAAAPSAFELALDGHQAFAATDLAEGAPSAEIRPASLPGAAIVPDLTDAGLTVRHATVETIHGWPALHLGYVGTRGCRVSLWVGPAAIGLHGAKPPDLTLTAAWRVAEIGYLLLASGMPADRFASLAQAAERATREAGELPAQSRLALRSGRAHSPPCIG